MTKNQKLLNSQTNIHNNEIFQQFSQEAHGGGDEGTTDAKAISFIRRNIEDYERNLKGNKILTKEESCELEKKFAFDFAK